MSKKIITNKQNTILTLLLTFRFLNSKQIQQFLSHKDHRRINGWLKDLTDKGYIDRDFTPIYGILTKPAVFNLSSIGRKYIRDNYQDVSMKYLGKLREDKDRSKSFRVKCQIVADLYLAHYPDKVDKFIEKMKEHLTDGLILEDNKNGQFFTSAFYEVLEEIIPILKLKPDAYMYDKTKEGITHCAFYVLDAYVPRLMLQYFLKNIFTTLDEEYWEEDDIESLQIYVLCPNNMVIIYLRRLLKSFLERYYGKLLIFHFATRNQLSKRIKTKSGKTGWITVSSEDETE